MWCKNCRQDVPAVAADDRRATRCCSVRRGVAPAGPVAVTVHTAGLEGSGDSDFDLDDQDSTPLEPDGGLDDWALDVELQRLHRLVTAAMPSSTAAIAGNAARVLLAIRQNGSNRQPGSSTLAVSRVAPRRRASIVVWSLLGFGIMAFVCGAILLAWSLIADRSELWTLGMPACLAGQLGLLLGLVFQLSRLWDDNRQTASATCLGR